MNFNWKTVGIIALFLGVIALIWWAVKSARTGKDVKTGVSNDKIQKSAESAGIPKPIAEQIAQAPDSEAAARRIGINPIIATAIANGIDFKQNACGAKGTTVGAKCTSTDANGKTCEGTMQLDGAGGCFCSCPSTDTGTNPVGNA